MTEQLNDSQRKSTLFLSNHAVKAKAVPLHVTEALGRKGDIAPTHSRW
jgi:hypothetical protein